MSGIKSKLPGVTLCFIIGIVAWTLGDMAPVIGGPVCAIIIGMLIGILIKDRSRLATGISYTSKKILQYAVILLGFGMNLSVVISTGIRSLPILIATISTSLIISYTMYRLLKMPTKISILIGVGSSICGGSAIAATAPVIEADESEIAQSISVIFLFNILAALIFPTLGVMLGLSNDGFGLFAGSAINDTSSVTAAGASWDAMHNSNAIDIATIVKMTRTLAIIPITLVLAFMRTIDAKSESKKVSIKRIFPYFILLFVLASIITTIATAQGIPASIFAPVKMLSKFLIVMAMSAIGINTDVIKLIRNGLKPILVGLTCWISIALVSLCMQKVMGLW